MIEKKRGFTLIELLVVVSIISLLSSVVLSSLNDARRKARNTQRISDVRQLVTAFNLARNDAPFPIVSGNTSAPTTCVSSSCYGSGGGSSGGWANQSLNVAVDAYLAPYLYPKLSDPPAGTRNRGGYIYSNPWTGIGNGVTYPLGAYLRWSMEPPFTCPHGGAVFSVNNNVCILRLD